MGCFGDRSPWPIGSCCGLIFGPWIFWGINEGPRDFFGFWFLPQFNHPRHLESGVPAPFGMQRGYNIYYHTSSIPQWLQFSCWHRAPTTASCNMSPVDAPDPSSSKRLSSPRVQADPTRRSNPAAESQARASHPVGQQPLSRSSRERRFSARLSTCRPKVLWIMNYEVRQCD